MSTANQIRSHYHQHAIYEAILKALLAQGVDLDSLSREELALVDEFHVRGAAVSQELALSIPGLAGKKVLDVGCGLGGAARLLADVYDCHVRGIDLTEEYIRTARLLSALVKLQEKTEFLIGDALDLPFANDSFEVVWTQHVQMNIKDKRQFYQEIFRVLRPGGYFVYYDIFRYREEALNYPMPWAGQADCSFLFKREHLLTILVELGAEVMEKREQTEAGIQFFEKVLSRLAGAEAPSLGLHILMGEHTHLKLQNLAKGLKKQALALESGLVQKST